VKALHQKSIVRAMPVFGGTQCCTVMLSRVVSICANELRILNKIWIYLNNMKIP